MMFSYQQDSCIVLVDVHSLALDKEQFVESFQISFLKKIKQDVLAKVYTGWRFLLTYVHVKRISIIISMQTLYDDHAKSQLYFLQIKRNQFFCIGTQAVF